MVAYDGDKAIGYAYCDASVIPEGAKHFRPNRPGPDQNANCAGFYPMDLKCPVFCTHPNNLYIDLEYRGKGIGKHIVDNAMVWLEQMCFSFFSGKEKG